MLYCVWVYNCNGHVCVSAMPAPKFVDKVVAQRMERIETYANNKMDMNKWQDTVTTNRHVAVLDLAKVTHVELYVFMYVYICMCICMYTNLMYGKKSLKYLGRTPYLLS